MSKFYCVTCNSHLTRIPEGEWIDNEGFIFCPVTDEIHYRTLREEAVNA